MLAKKSPFRQTWMCFSDRREKIPFLPQCDAYKKPAARCLILWNHPLFTMPTQKLPGFLLLSVALSLSSVARAASVADIKIDIPFNKFVLTSGLTLIVHEDHKAPVVAVKLWYHVGSKNEKPGKTGFAHLFEHLLFTGSEHLKNTGDQRAFFEAMERIGATDMNGTTNPDRTDYFETVPVNALDVALWVESDRMGISLV